MSLDDKFLERVRHLPPDKQLEAINFVNSLNRAHAKVLWKQRVRLFLISVKAFIKSAGTGDPNRDTEAE